jgi:hypothetical protein
MDWLERKVTKWLVDRIFLDHTWQRKLDQFNNHMIQQYRVAFYEDNHATMSVNLRERLDQALAQCVLKKFD